ncbi:MAL3P3.6 [Symbiodinium sp. CCMP2592]|nr:MAL3P3.6 [Symbiodinium sp. CCMP2592]
MQSTTITDESLDPTDEPKESSDAGSGSTKGVPKTGKDHVPEYDGKTAMREYARRVKLFESSTGIDPSYRAQKLMEKLSGQAWMATESLDLEDLKHPSGVQRLLDHLWQELEPLEHLRTFTTFAEFYKDFRRSPGEEFVEFDMKFRAHLKRLEEVGAKLEGLNVAYWFLEKSGLSSELRKQVVAAASGECDYPKLRKALMAIVPKVKKDEEHGPSTARPYNRQWKLRSNQPRQVNAATEEAEDGPDPDDGEADEVGPEELEGELEVLLTQTARKRAEIERARGFSKPETGAAREARIKEMKSRMPCSACKANGRTVYGHWHGDAECPFRKGGGADKDRHREKSVLAVVEEELSDSEDDILDPPASSIFHSTTIYDGTEQCDVHANQAPPYHVYSNGGEPDRNRLALSDTCCARTVAGKKWAQRHLRYLRARGEDVFVIDEARPFRFGGGPRVMSEYAVIMPLIVYGASKLAWVRVSIVDQDVPLLLSKTALKMLGMVMDLEKSVIILRELETQVQLRETKAGLCGFEINLERSGRRLEAPPQVLIENDQEVVLEDDVPGDQVMMVQKIHPPVTDGEQARTTREVVDRCEDRARKLYRECDFRYQSLLELVRMLPIHRRARHREINGKPGPLNEAWVAGLFAHGNYSGVTKRTCRYPHVVRYVNSFMRDKVDGTWSSFSLAKNISTDVHVDCHNHKEASSVTVTFGDFTGGQLWVAQSESEGQDCTWKQGRHGRTIPGTLISTRESPHMFNPQVPHATHDWTGERWCLSMYTVRKADQVDEDTKKALKKLRFPLSSRGTSRTLGDAVHAVHDMSSHREPHQQIDDVSHGMECADTPQLLEDCGEIEEFVAAIASRSKVTKEALREHNLDRLKELWGALRPPKKNATGLPANWKKLDRSALKHIYATQVVPDLGRDSDLHWDRWSKPTLILEIEVWALDAAEELQRDRDLEMTCTEPLCAQCGIPMMVRTNRLTREDFYGCRRYPACKQTLPLRYDGRPTGEVQKELETTEKINKAKEHHKKIVAKQAAKGKRMGEMGRATASSDGSWAVAGAIPIEEVTSSDEEKDKKYNTNLTKEEMAMIVAMRDKNRGYPKNPVPPIVKKDNNPEDCEVEERILHGRARRKMLKKGVVKRLLGNARAIVAGVFVTTAALVGAAASAVPNCSRMRPDVLEICGHEASFTSSFSRWGWRHVEPVQLPSDLCDGRNRDTIGRWIDESAPRLVIVSDCCPRVASVGRIGVKESQALRRQRKREDRVKPVCEFLKHVVDMQIKRGDQALVELALHATPEDVHEMAAEMFVQELYRAFDRGWARWAGPPIRATVDMEGGFQGYDIQCRLTREVSWAKNSLTREHGREPLGPSGYHPSVGEAGSDVAVRMRYRYHAKMEFIRSQARQMLLRTAHNRTRKIPIPKIGQLVFFWREARGKRGDNHSSWHGPGYVVGIQDRNAWVTIGGRSFLVAGEHLREAVGDEKHFGNPEIQKAIALFRKIPSEATYEDLDLTEGLDMEVDAMETEGLSAEHADMVPQVGQWKCLEKEVKWAELEDHHQFIPGGIMIVHVDDVMFCHDGSAWGHEVATKVHDRFPFGTWMKVAEQESGITYCGKEIKIRNRDGEISVVLSQNAFIDGRLQPMTLSNERVRQPDAHATDVEKTDYRSVVGSLQWLAVQSRTDWRLSSGPLGEDAELVTYHDAGLYSSVGVEIDERECEDILQRGNEKRLVYSQKGACIGFVRKGATDHEQHAHMNLIDWKSSTNRRVVESSFAAETHAAIMGHNMSRFAQVLLSEIRYGSQVISAIEDDGWQQLAPLTLVTDCRSIYDTIHKDGQHVGEKGNIVHAVLVRQLLTTRGREIPGKAKLLWVPTRCQLADGFTKAGRGSDIREQLTRGLLFHESSLKRRNPLKRTGQRDGCTGVNVASKA